MKGEKTTRQILDEKLVRKEATPLYNPAAHKTLWAHFEHWRNTVVREQDRKDWTSTPHTIVGSDIPRDLLYSPLNNPDLDYEQDLGFSGEGIRLGQRENTSEQHPGFTRVACSQHLVRELNSKKSLCPGLLCTSHEFSNVRGLQIR